jgi:hypothetical protein
MESGIVIEIDGGNRYAVFNETYDVALDRLVDLAEASHWLPAEITVTEVTPPRYMNSELKTVTPLSRITHEFRQRLRKRLYEG